MFKCKKKRLRIDFKSSTNFPMLVRSAKQMHKHHNAFGEIISKQSVMIALKKKTEFCTIYEKNSNQCKWKKQID